jgi:hypothetical protein
VSATTEKPVGGQGSIIVSAGPTVFVPIGNFENVARPSIGFSALGGFQVLDALAIVGLWDYSYINKQEVLSSEINFSTFLVGGGLRLSPAIGRIVQPFAQAVVGVHTTRQAVNNTVTSESAAAIKLGGGIAIQAGPLLRFGGQISYSHAAYEDVPLGGVLLQTSATLLF